MDGKDGWRLVKKESELKLHIPQGEGAHYRAMLCDEGSLGVVGEGWASQGVFS